MRRQKPNLAFKPIIITAVLLLLLGSAAVCFRKILTTSDYFKIKDVIIKDEHNIDLSYLKGHNIFSVDLAMESRYIADAYPAYRKIRLVRVLPNRIYVSSIRRTPVAYVKLYRLFYVDQDGMLFSPSLEPAELELPVIVGLETKIFGPRPGRIYNIRELALALNIIEEINKNKALRSYRVKKIDVASPGNTSFTLLENLEVKVGQDDIGNKIKILPGLFAQVKPSPDSIKYIDLRFKEPVIKLKDEKQNR